MCVCIMLNKFIFKIFNNFVYFLIEICKGLVIQVSSIIHFILMCREIMLENDFLLPISQWITCLESAYWLVDILGTKININIVFFLLVCEKQTKKIYQNSSKLISHVHMTYSQIGANGIYIGIYNLYVTKVYLF